MPLQAVIFDFDGVIVDSERFWRKEEEGFFQSVILNWNKEDHHKIVGMTMAGSYELFKKDYEITISLEDYLEEYKDIARRVYKQCSLIEGVTDLIKNLKNENIPLAVASSAPGKHVKNTLKTFEILDIFQTIVTAEDIGQSEGKPNPAIYLLAASKLQLEPCTCIAIEDAKNGVIAAKAAGMKCVGVDFPNSTPQDLAQADLVITKFDELNSKNLEALF
ncbi:MAG: HAD-IA family hydrolase [Kiritimatiellales bacterium]|nr:HAD-IA family hydrolase [Kiritimatiellales bacterium]